MRLILLRHNRSNHQNNNNQSWAHHLRRETVAFKQRAPAKSKMKLKSLLLIGVAALLATVTQATQYRPSLYSLEP